MKNNNNTNHNSEYYSKGNAEVDQGDQSTKSNFATIISSLIAALLGKATSNIYSNIQHQVDEQIKQKKRFVTRKVVTTTLLSLGALLAVYGGIQVIMDSLDMYLYTNLVVGVVFVLSGLIPGLVLKD